MNNRLSYTKSGINIDETDKVKLQMKSSIDTGDPRILNRLGAFGSLVEGQFEGYSHPILVLKTEEPGSKQKLAFQYYTCRREGPGKDMLRTFNMGIGLAIVVAPEYSAEVISHFNQNECDCYEIGSIEGGQKKIRFEGSLIL